MPKSHRPRLILVPLDHRIMPNTERANGKGHSRIAAMPYRHHPPQPFNRGPLNLSQKCHTSHAPTLQQGVVNSPQKCLRRCTPTLQQGATQMTQKCQEAHAPTLFGAAEKPQKCQLLIAPTTRGHSSYAEMSFCLRLA